MLLISKPVALAELGLLSYRKSPSGLLRTIDKRIIKRRPLGPSVNYSVTIVLQSPSGLCN